MRLYFSFFLLSLLLGASTIEAKGQVVGCLVDSKIYTVKTGTDKTTNRPIYSSDRTFYPLNYEGNAVANATPGYVNTNWISYNMSVTYAYPYGCIVGGSTGTQVTSFKVNPVLNVPLDDHIWLIMLSGVGLGAFYLTKNKLSLPE